MYSDDVFKMPVVWPIYEQDPIVMAKVRAILYEPGILLVIQPLPFLIGVKISYLVLREM
jgi:hypothetical protein